MHDLEVVVDKDLAFLTLNLLLQIVDLVDILGKLFDTFLHTVSLILLVLEVTNRHAVLDRFLYPDLFDGIEIRTFFEVKGTNSPMIIFGTCPIADHICLHLHLGSTEGFCTWL